MGLHRDNVNNNNIVPQIHGLFSSPTRIKLNNMDTGIKCKPEVATVLNDAAKESTQIAYCTFKMAKDEAAPGRKAKDFVVLDKKVMKDEFPDEKEVRAKCDDKDPPPSFKHLQEYLLSLSKEENEIAARYFLYTFNWKKEGGDRTLPILIKYIGDGVGPQPKMTFTGTWATVKKSCSNITVVCEANGQDEIPYKHLLDYAITQKN